MSDIKNKKQDRKRHVPDDAPETDIKNKKDVLNTEPAAKRQKVEFKAIDLAELKDGQHFTWQNKDPAVTYVVVHVIGESADANSVYYIPAQEVTDDDYEHLLGMCKDCEPHLDWWNAKVEEEGKKGPWCSHGHSCSDIEIPVRFAGPSIYFTISDFC